MAPQEKNVILKNKKDKKELSSLEISKEGKLIEQTNVFGTYNVIKSSIENNISKAVILSTDKAVYPINAMGVSKAMMEKIFVAKSKVSDQTIILGTRYGNVMASRGSVIPLFYNQIKTKSKITITDPKMTRFMMTLDNAVDLVMYAFNNGTSGDIFVQKSPSSTIGDLAIAMKKIYKSDVKIQNIGVRHGEKFHETLLSKEEKQICEDLGEYFRIPADNRDLNYDKFYSKGTKIKQQDEFNSYNTKRLSSDELISILNSIGYK